MNLVRSFFYRVFYVFQDPYAQDRVDKGEHEILYVFLSPDWSGDRRACGFVELSVGVSWGRDVVSQCDSGTAAGACDRGNPSGRPSGYSGRA